jgi:CHAT domain-containing protein/Tfp pilus assembly protein PilF
VTARIIGGIVAAGSFWVALVAGGSTRGQASPATLVPGTAVERELGGGGQQVYQLAMTAGEYTSVIVEQRGIDVTVHVDGADGRPIADFQDEITTQGEEHVELVADVGGTFTLTIKAVLNNAPQATYRIHIGETRRATDTDRSMQEARSLRRTAGLLRSAGNTDAARPQLERALAIAEGVRGPEDTYVATLVGELAQIHADRRDYAKAETLHQRALTVMERTLGSEHPMTALALSRLGDVYTQTGQRRKAETIVQRALEISEKALGPEHPQVASCLNILGALREQAGDDQKAEELNLRGMAITERTQGLENLLYASLLNNLGVIYKDRNEFERADQLLRRSLAIAEKLSRADDSWVANALQNIGSVARQRGDLATAEAYTVRALSIREKIVGSEHPDIASNLINLANIYKAKGDLARSIETHLRALGIWEKTTGPYSPGTQTALGNIARAYAAAGDLRRAITFQERADAVLDKQLALNLAIGSERQKLAFVNAVSDRADRTVSLNLDAAPDDQDASRLAALVILQRKGRVLDAMTDTLGTIRQRGGSAEDIDLLEQLRQTTARLAQLALNGPPETTAEVRLTTIRQLEDQKEKLEAAISERSAEFRAQLQPVTVETVRSRVPPDSALIEFSVFRPFDPRALNVSDMYGEPHYAAYVIRGETPPSGTDLGPARRIDDTIRHFREALADPKREEVKQLAREMDEQVLRPIYRLLGPATRLLISPDGALNLIPFEALTDNEGRYLVERYSVSYLTSGRDLLRMQVPRMSRREPVLVADPFFGEPPTEDHPNGARVSGRARHRSVTTANDMSSMYFAPLSGTSLEADGIKSLFPEATVLKGRDATKAALEQLEAPSILHIATHGFFVQETRGDTNPLLRSGLALAGANLRSDFQAEGILTASELSSLNLWGTKLVTLSACQTGVGEVRNGEGVYGLRRAVFMAGAETLVMSLWGVSDSVTRQMMTTFYSGLKRGLGRGEALRQAQLVMLGRKSRQHPFYWASFIQAGEWANLAGQR